MFKDCFKGKWHEGVATTSIKLALELHPENKLGNSKVEHLPEVTYWIKFEYYLKISLHNTTKMLQKQS